MKKQLFIMISFSVLLLSVWSVAFFQKANISVNLLGREGGGIFPVLSAVEIESGKIVKIVQGENGTLIHFWATWCAPCLAELPDLIAYSNNLPKGYRVYIVAGSDKLKNVKKFLSKFKNNSKNIYFLFDGKGIEMRKMGTLKLPETYIYNSSGQFISKIPGATNWKVFAPMFGL